MTTDSIKASVDAFVKANGITKATWTQTVAACILMQVTLDVCKAKGIALPAEVRGELFDAWKFHGIACNASQLRQYLFDTKATETATVPMPYKFND